MKKHKVSELSGVLLDEAVAKACGYSYRKHYYFVFLLKDDVETNVFRPHVEWRSCGPLIPQFKIDHISRSSGICEVSTEDEVYAWGKDELEAICRVVVKTVFGDEVEL